jgi:glycosyltransferase involved in cell wall biosynthesis
MLFVIDSLDTAGAEKSLVTLLSMLDYSEYDVDLQLFAQGYALESLVPAEVNILKPLTYSIFAMLNLKESIKYALSNKAVDMLIARMKYSICIRKKQHNNPQKAILFWQSISRVIEENPATYDVAISYAQGIPTYYTAEKVKAKKKFAWVNVSYQPNESEKVFQKRFYDQYDKIIAVSESTKKVLLESFPMYLKKVSVIYDINNPDFIANMADSGKSYEDSFDGLRILSIGRLAYQKGYDIALESCKKLKEQEIKFRWYVLGKGPLESEIKDYIKRHDLSKHFILLGVKANPYPYIKNADLYVQTSRFEGFGLAIAEARMLNIPVVTTKFDAVYNQMIDGKNGLVVDLNADAVSEGILRMVNDKTLQNDVIDYLHSEKKGNVEELERFYQLIG